MMVRWLCASLFCLLFCEEFVNAANYDKMSNVLSLNADNFERSTSTGRWLIIFHLRTCGGCIRYADYFQRFAKDVANWPQYAIEKSSFRIGSLDCSEESVKEICVEYKVGGVPTLRYLSGTPSLRRVNPIGVHVVAHDDVQTLRRDVVALILQEVTIVNSRSSNDQYELTVSSGSVLENTLIILEFTSKLQQSMISQVNPNMDQMIIKFSLHNIAMISGPPEYIRQMLYNVVYNHGGQQRTTVTTSAPLTTRVYSRPVPVYASDLFLSLSTALQLDVSLVESITGEKLEALKEFLSMLLFVLPASEEYVTHLSNLSEWLGGQTNITGKQWSAQLRDSNFPIHSGEYQACKGSQPRYRGYPCGLWLLFHALTVSHCRREAQGMRLPGDIVAHALNRFVPNFFSCTVCAFHFAASSANVARPGESKLPQRIPPSASEFQWDPTNEATLPTAPKTCEQEILWLNTLHNYVNERLSGSPTDDPSAPKMVYPPRWLCSACWSLQPGQQNVWVIGKTQASRQALLRYLNNRFQSSAWLTRGVPSMFRPSNRQTYK